MKNFVPNPSLPQNPDTPYARELNFALLRSLRHLTIAANESSRKLGETVSVTDFGAKGDGTSDDTDAFLAALEETPTGGDLFVPACESYYLLSDQLVLNGINLVGPVGYRGGNGPQLRTNSYTGPLVKTTAGMGSSIRNLRVRGIITSTGLIELNGIDAATNLSLDFSGRYGIQLTSSSIACLVEDIVGTNMVYARSGATQYGALDVNGTDHYISRVEMNCSSGQSGAVSANKVAVGIYVRSANNFVDSSIAEFCDVGYVISGSKNRIANSRADRCMGDGWLVSGSHNVFVGVHAIECGTVANNTYDGFIVSGSQNTVIGLQIPFLGTTTLRYGIRDTVSNNTQKNRYLAPYVSEVCATAQYNWNSFAPSAFTLASAATRLTSGTTIDVSQLTDVRLAYAAPATVTTLSNGIPGQTVTFYVASGSSTVTFQHNASIQNRSGADTAVAAGQSISYRFIPDDNLWTQL